MAVPDRILLLGLEKQAAYLDHFCARMKYKDLCSTVVHAGPRNITAGERGVLSYLLTRRATRYTLQLPLGTSPKNCAPEGQLLRTHAKATQVPCAGSVKLIHPSECSQRAPSSVCAARNAQWRPDEWEDRIAGGKLPSVSDEQLARACDSIKVQ